MESTKRMKRKWKVNRDYELCNGCGQNWHLKDDYACQRCLIEMAEQQLKNVVEELVNMRAVKQPDITIRPMIRID
jgi:hypothetical protein